MSRAAPSNRAAFLGERIAHERLFEAPRDHTLSECECIEVQLSGTGSMTFKAADIARHLGLSAPIQPLTPCGLARVGELAGAVVMASSFTRASVRGRTWPTRPALYSWKVDSLWFVDGDEVTLMPTRPGLFRMWPFVRSAPRPIINLLSERIEACSTESP